MDYSRTIAFLKMNISEFEYLLINENDKTKAENLKASIEEMKAAIETLETQDETTPLKEEKAVLQQYNIEGVRIGYGFKTITVQAPSLKDAEDAALEKAGDYEFSEKSSEYITSP